MEDILLNPVDKDVIRLEFEDQSLRVSREHIFMGSPLDCKSFSVTITPEELLETLQILYKIKQGEK